jgi:hypothetical protein
LRDWHKIFVITAAVNFAMPIRVSGVNTKSRENATRFGRHCAANLDLRIPASPGMRKHLRLSLSNKAGVELSLGGKLA